MEYIKAVLAELPDVDTTDNKFLDYVPSLNFKERNKLLNLAIKLVNLEPSERLNKADNIINYKFNLDLYGKLPGNDSIEKAKNFLNDRYIEFDCNNTVKETVSTIPTNKQKQFNNWLSELKKATEKQRPEIRRNFLLTVLSNHNIIEFYNILEGKNCETKANILLNKWSIEWEAEKYPKSFQEAYRFKEEKVVKNQNEELNQDLLLLL